MRKCSDSLINYIQCKIELSFCWNCLIKLLTYIIYTLEIEFTPILAFLVLVNDFIQRVLSSGRFPAIRESFGCNHDEIERPCQH